MKRILRALHMAAAVVLFSGAAHGQSAVTPDGQQRARQVLAAAIEALGGQAAVQDLRALELVQVDSAYTRVQSRKPGDLAHILATSRSVVDLVGGRVRREARTKFPDGYGIEFLTLLDSDGGATVDLEGNRMGRDYVRMPAAQAGATRLAIERLSPHLILRQAAGDAAALREQGASELDGRPQAVLAYTDPAGNEVRLHIDRASHRLTRLERNLSPATVATVDFTDYRAAGGLVAPHRSVTRIGGEIAQVSSLVRVAANPDLGVDLFEIPAGYTEAPPARAPAAVRLAEGIYALEGLPGGYRSMFIELDDHVVVLEAPESPAHAKAALGLIRGAAPGKPVRYVLATHHHGDHTAGLAAFAAEGAVIVGGPGIEAVAGSLPGKGGVPAAVEVVSGRRAFGTGTREVVAYQVKTVHAETMLVFHFPAQRLLFQGDLLTVPERGDLPRANPLNRELADAIGGLGLDVETILGVHGRPVSTAELRRMLEGDRRAARP